MIKLFIEYTGVRNVC